MSKTVQEIVAIFEAAKSRSRTEPEFKELVRRQFFRVMADEPYNLTLDDFIAAYESPEVNPDPSDPFGGGGAGFTLGWFTPRQVGESHAQSRNTQPDAFGGGGAGVAPDPFDGGGAGKVAPKE